MRRPEEHWAVARASAQVPLHTRAGVRFTPGALGSVASQKECHAGVTALLPRASRTHSTSVTGSTAASSSAVSPQGGPELSSRRTRSAPSRSWRLSPRGSLPDRSTRCASSRRPPDQPQILRAGNGESLRREVLEELLGAQLDLEAAAVRQPHLPRLAAHHSDAAHLARRGPAHSAGPHAALEPRANHGVRGPRLGAERGGSLPHALRVRLRRRRAEAGVGRTAQTGRRCTARPRGRKRDQEGTRRRATEGRRHTARKFSRAFESFRSRGERI